MWQFNLVICCIWFVFANRVSFWQARTSLPTVWMKVSDNFKFWRGIVRYNFKFEILKGIVANNFFLVHTEQTLCTSMTTLFSDAKIVHGSEERPGSMVATKWKIQDRHECGGVIWVPRGQQHLLVKFLRWSGRHCKIRPPTLGVPHHTLRSCSVLQKNDTDMVVSPWTGLVAWSHSDKHPAQRIEDYQVCKYWNSTPVRVSLFFRRVEGTTRRQINVRVIIAKRGNILAPTHSWLNLSYTVAHEKICTQVNTNILSHRNWSASIWKCFWIHMDDVNTHGWRTEHTGLWYVLKEIVQNKRYYGCSLFRSSNFEWKI